MYGNDTAMIQTKTVVKNDIGEGVETWTDSFELFGYLDFQSGQNDLSQYDAKVQETTHIFLCDYREIMDHIGELNSEDCRLICKNQIYQILMVDDPMELHRHIEVFLKYVGIGLGV